MAQLRKDRARKPLADGLATLSYGMRCDANDGANGITFRMFEDKAMYNNAYSFQITNAELDAAILLRQTFGQQHEVAFDDKALYLANKEIEKDERDGKIGLDQAMKALEMAYAMLRTFVPAIEQDRNGTLAYIASVARY